MEELVPSLTAYLLILTRITAFFVTVPLFSYRSIPATQRIIFGALLAWMLVYTIDVPDMEIDGTYLLLVMKEAMIGLFIGIIAFIVMSAIQIAGGFIDFQMGFAIANVIDPQTGAQSPLLGQFFNSLAILLLLALNGHHMLLDGIFYSYQFMPMDQLWPAFGEERLVEFVIQNICYLICNCLSNVYPNCCDIVSSRLSTRNYSENSSTVEYICCRFPNQNWCQLSSCC